MPLAKAIGRILKNNANHIYKILALVSKNKRIGVWRKSSRVLKESHKWFDNLKLLYYGYTCSANNIRKGGDISYEEDYSNEGSRFYNRKR